MEHIYTDGSQPDDRERANEHFPFQVYIENANKGYIGGFTMPLPTTAEALRPFLEGAEIAGWQDMKIWEAESDIEGLGEKVTEAFQASLSPDTLNELNYLAARIDSLQPEEFAIFSAAMQAGWHCGTVSELINLTHNTDAFYLQPANNAAQYGEFLVDMFKDETSAAFIKLEQSDSAEQRDFAQHVLRLEAAVDFKAYGRNYADEENGVFTDHGYITEVGQYEVVYRGSEDIFDEHRVFDGNALLEAQQRDTEPPVMLKNADLTALLMKIHALGGDYMSDARFNMTILEGRRTAEYFLLMREQSLYLTGAAHAYRVGTTANDNIMNAAESAGAKVFMLLVTDMHQPHVIGDIAELNLAELQRDIRRHCISHTRVDAVPKIGPEVSYTPEQWDALDAEDLHRLQSWTRHFESADLQAVLSHVHDVRERREEAGKEIPEDIFLAELNKQYMLRAENPQPDMIRVTLPAAKEMLLHEDAEVYRLFPQGSERLDKLDALPARGGLWYLENREFAIRPRDLGNLDHWASREMTNICRAAPERGEKDKQKSHGPEL